MALRDALKVFSVLCHVLSSDDIDIHITTTECLQDIGGTYLFDDERTAKLLSKVDQWETIQGIHGPLHVTGC